MHKEKKGIVKVRLSRIKWFIQWTAQCCLCFFENFFLNVHRSFHFNYFKKQKQKLRYQTAGCRHIASSHFIFPIVNRISNFVRIKKKRRRIGLIDYHPKLWATVLGRQQNVSSFIFLKGPPPNRLLLSNLPNKERAGEKESRSTRTELHIHMQTCNSIQWAIEKGLLLLLLGRSPLR